MEVRVIEGSASGGLPQPAPGYYEPNTVIRDGALVHDFTLYVATKASSGALTIQPAAGMDGGADPLDPGAPHILKTLPFIHGMGGITNENLAGGITNNKLAGGITNEKLAGGITGDKLAGGIPWDKMDGTAPASDIPQLEASKVTGGDVTEKKLIPDLDVDNISTNWKHGSTVTITKGGLYIIQGYALIRYDEISNNGAIYNAVLIGTVDGAAYYHVSASDTIQGNNSFRASQIFSFVYRIPANTLIRFASKSTVNYPADTVKTSVHRGVVTYLGA
jgi:hypothetical protein